MASLYRLVFLLLSVCGGIFFVDALHPPVPAPISGGRQHLRGSFIGWVANGAHDRVLFEIAGRQKIQLILPEVSEAPPLDCPLSVDVELHLPTSFRNDGGTDYARSLARNGIVATGRLIDWEKVDRESHASCRASAEPFQSIKDRLASQFERLSDSEAKGFLYALVLGRSDKVPPSLREVWQELGIYHLLVVSGLHLGIFYFLFYRAGLVLSSFIPLFFRRWVRQDVATLVALVGALFPLCFYPPSPSLARAYGSVLVWSILKLLRIPMSSGRLLVFLCLAFLLAEPMILFDLSFQMTFLCLFSILVLGVPLQHKLIGLLALPDDKVKWASVLLGIFSASLAVFIGLAPIAGALQGRIHFSGIFLNLVLVPLLGGVATVLLLVACFVGLWIFPVLTWVAKGLMIFLHAIDFFYRHCDLSLLSPFYTPAWGIAYWLMLFVSVALEWIQFPRRRIVQASLWSVALVATLVWPSVHSGGKLRIVFFDVGQGESYLVQTPDRRAYLVDGGGLVNRRSSIPFNIGAHVLVPALRAQGVSQLDALILSHPHPDHYLGFEGVLGVFPVREFWSTGEVSAEPSFLALLQMIKEKGVVTKRIDGTMPEFALGGGVDLVPLYPHLPVSLYPHGGNASSLVARLDYKTFSLMMTGDIEHLGETTLAYGPRAPDLGSIVLKIPHHGSKTSSSLPFLDLVRPQIAIGSMGIGNHFGHPAPDVIARYRDRNMDIFRTDEDGEIVLETDGQSVNISTYTGRDFHSHL